MNPERSRTQGNTKFIAKKVDMIVKKLDGSPILLDVLLNKSFYVDALLDTGCLCYAAFNHSFVKRNKLPQIPIHTRELRLAKKDPHRRVINRITCVDIDIDGRLEKVYGYVIEDLAYNMILGDPWMR